ncbi:MAG: HAD hydrolase-like protein [Oscillospiraceae bacterium]|nr:HAD hydrolase-like protein [Oscillospiraceae bacterium]
MSRYKLAVFDVDGTLLDTTQGVLASVRYTIDHFGFKMPDNERLKKFIGPPIQDSFADLYDLKGDILQDIATVFRNRYKSSDLLKAKPYDGIYDVMDKLRQENVICAIATYKREDYAVELLDHFGFNRYSDIIYGADHENKLKKSDIIKKCLKSAQIEDYREAVMIGDTMNDAVGAGKLGMDFIAVTYGFGFKTASELDKTGKIGYTDSTDGILALIL